jgi:hypothetical protein
VDFGVQAYSHFRYRSKDPQFMEERTGHWDVPDTWRSALMLGYTHTLGDTVTLHFAAALAQNLLWNGSAPEFGANSHEHAMSVGLGGVQTVGLRPQPLVRVHLTDRWSLSFNADLVYALDTRRVYESYTAGVTMIGPRFR